MIQLVETATQRIEEDLLARISRNNIIINGLEHNQAFNLMLDDFKEQLKKIDDNWHLIPTNQLDKLYELRITKLATVSLINVLESYKFDLNKATQTLAEIQHPDKLQSSYYDKE